MRNLIGWRGLLGVMLTMAVTACARAPQNSAAPSGPATEGMPAPDFTLKGVDGRAVSLSSHAGKVVFLDFWATWCPPCRSSLPHTQKLADSEAAKRGRLVVLAIDQGEPAADVKQFLAEQKLTMTCLLDADRKLGQVYGAEGIPLFVVIGADGRIVYKQNGWSPETDGEIDRSVTESLKAVKPAK